MVIVEIPHDGLQERGLAMTGEVIRFRVILSNPNKTLSYMRPWLLRRRLMMDCKN